MNITLTPEQVKALNDFAQGAATTRISIVVSRTGVITGGYWDDEADEAVLIVLNPPPVRVQTLKT